MLIITKVDNNNITITKDTIEYYLAPVYYAESYNGNIVIKAKNTGEILYKEDNYTNVSVQNDGDVTPVTYASAKACVNAINLFCGVGFNTGGTASATTPSAIPLYVVGGTSTNLTLTIPNYKKYTEGDTFKIKLISDLTAESAFININSLGDIQFYSYSNTIGFTSNNYKSGSIIEIVYTDSSFLTVSTQYSALKSVSSYYGIDTNTTTYVTDKTNQLNKYLPICSIIKNYSNSYVDGCCFVAKLTLLEVSRGVGKTALEEINLTIIISIPTYTSTTFISTIANIKIYASGVLIDTILTDIALVQILNNSTQKQWVLYIKGKTADKIFCTIPLTPYGRSFSSNSASTFAGTFAFNPYNNYSPLSELPTPVQGSVITAETR